MKESKSKQGHKKGVKAKGKPAHKKASEPIAASRVEQALSKLRRYWLSKARKGYIAHQLTLRQGECLRCARCCSIFFKCPFLVDNACKIYGVRFKQCRTFPIDGRDVKLIGKLGGKCGYTFEGNGQ